MPAFPFPGKWSDMVSPAPIGDKCGSVQPGVGHKRKGYIPLVCSQAHIEVMRAIKRALDPNNILYPGKIFDV